MLAGTKSGFLFHLPSPNLAFRPIPLIPPLPSLFTLPASINPAKSEGAKLPSGVRTEPSRQEVFREFLA